MTPESPRLSYYAQLRTPEWIEFATRIKAEADWTCEHCKRKQGDVELTVHHTYYLSATPLWEHPRCLLIVLCRECHQERQAIEQDIYVAVADILRNRTNAEILAQPVASFFTEGFTIGGGE